MRPTILLALLALGLGLSLSSESRGQAGQRRQFYTSWQYSEANKYHYREYYYKAKPTADAYKKQYVVYKPARTKNYVYWYNPDTKKYWGRCPTVHHAKYGADVKKGKDIWAMLPDAKKKTGLDDIRDDDFGADRETSPPIPGSNDGGTINCPPSDLPPN